MPSETRVSPEDYFMGIAMAVRRRANCHGNRVGAIVVLDGRIISTGYNGTPANMPNCLDGGCHRCANREQYPSGTGYDLCICVHAEQNALLAAARFGIAVAGATMYTTSPTSRMTSAAPSRRRPIVAPVKRSSAGSARSRPHAERRR